MIQSNTEQAKTPSSQDGPEVAANIILEGKDNYGKPRQEFADKIAAMSDGGFLEAAEQHIWLSAYANNNPRSDYHWQAGACYDEAARRGKPHLYTYAWERASRSAR